MKENTRTRLVVLAHLALVAISIAAVRFGRGALPSARAGGPVPPAAAEAAPEVRDGKIQVALLLDTSGSMGGLIDQARSQLWKIVTRLDGARRAGKRAQLQIALFEYGNPSRANADAGWIRQVMPFSGDLDRVSEALFALDTNGGDEYAGQVIRTAVRALAWSGKPGDLKMIFIAGNEDFAQGPVAPAAAVAEARARGIRVNVIHCGGDDPSWREGARLAASDYLMIDHNQAVAHVAAPQDDEIARLGLELNATYLAYGAEGLQGAERQKRQDLNAATTKQGAPVWRSVAKASTSYKNASWDLGDAVSDGKVALDKVKDSELPEAMRAMNLEQRRAYVQQKVADRTRLAKRIRDLSVEREKFVSVARAKAAGKGAAASSLDAAMLGAATTAATAAGFHVE